MTSQDNMAAQQRWGEAVNTGDLVALDELAAPDVIDHDPAPSQGPGPQGFKDLFTELRTPFPDLHIDVDHITVAEEDVAVAYTIRGTHNGPLMGHPPTGKTVAVRGVQIGRFADGKLAGRWGSSDQLGMLSQPGVLQP